jgi:hypothetical protein
MNTTPLEHQLHDLAAAFARRIAKLIGELTIEELAALCGDGAPVAKARRKKTAAPKPRTRKKAPRAPRPALKPLVETLAMPEAPTTIEPAETRPVPRVLPPPEDRAAAFQRTERERLETAVLKFVEQNPETDAEIVAVRVGLQKGKAQDVLDDLVLRGRLRMKSGQHGRCYVGVEERKP